jgi:hypothetical protein
LDEHECDVTMDDAETVEASYDDWWTVTVRRLAHGQVTSSPAGIDCGDSNDDCSAEFPTGSTVTFTASAASGYTTAGWNQGLTDSFTSGECSSAGRAATCTVKLDHSPRPFGANFYPQLTTQVVGSGGVIASGVGSVACPASSGMHCDAFAPGSAVVVDETAFAGYAFGAFDGCDDVVPLTGTTSQCQLHLDAPRTVTTTFAGTYQAVASVTSNTYGRVTMSPCPGGTCDTLGVGNFTTTFDAATPVTLTEAPTAQGAFVGWSGGGCSGMSTTCTTTIGAFLDSGSATHITANYVATSQLRVTVVGQGAVTTASPPGMSCGADSTCSVGFAASPLLTATAASGWTFAGWTGGVCSGTGTCSPVVSGDPAPITATFVPPAPIVTAAPAGAPTSSSVVLNGILDPNGSDTAYLFEWGTTSDYGTSTFPGVVLAGSGSVPVTTQLGALTPGVT